MPMHFSYCRTLATIVAMNLISIVGASHLRADKPPRTAPKPAPIHTLLDALIQTAAVVEGTVESINFEYTDDAGPWTVVTLSAVKVHVGSAPSTIQIRQFGGPRPDGRIVMMSDDTRFVVGQTYLVFLRNTAWHFSPIVNNIALRVDTMNGREVLVDPLGRVVTRVLPSGIQYSQQIFDQPQIDGQQAPLAFPGSDQATTTLVMSSAPDRQALISAINTEVTSNGLVIGGDFYDLPDDGFSYRGTPVSKNK